VVELTARELSDETVAHRLRTGNPAVLARLRDGKVILDVRTIFQQQETDLVEAVRAAVATNAER
jgi:L-seryl-tRNA(Ser) seleniumtransferase